MEQQELYLSRISKEDFLREIKEAAKEGAREEFQKLSNDKLLTQQEASDFLSVSKTTIIDWAKRGKIRQTKIRGRCYYKQSDLLNSKPQGDE